jgi:hypothetical protein
MAGWLMNTLGAGYSGASTAGTSGSAPEQIGTLDTGIATNDSANPTNPADGAPTQTPAQPQNFFQQHPRASQAMQLLFGARPLPPGSPQSAAPPQTQQPQPQAPSQQQPGNASTGALSGIIQALAHPLSGQGQGATLGNFNFGGGGGGGEQIGDMDTTPDFGGGD